MSGHERTLREWLHAHRGILIRISRAYATDKDDEQDLQQEILLALWRSLPRFRGEAKVSTWVYQVALLAMEPASAPGEAFLYSNAGYILIGAVLEAQTGESWENLLRAEVLTPLKLSSADFGPPGAAGEVTQPWGHIAQPGQPLTPAPPGPSADNPPFLGPAGTLHMTVGDLVRWGREHLRGERGQDGVLTAGSFRRLHTPPVDGADYALGWAVRATGAQRVIWHNGSNTMWYAIVAFDPAQDVGVVLVTNGSIAAGRALDSAAMRIVADWAGGYGR